MQLGMVGLGRMGANMVRRLLNSGHRCVAFDVSRKAVEELSILAGRVRQDQAAVLADQAAAGKLAA
jgi:6-phosphogluconate dehydrogenase (decarboxylating)